jgi:hypothetical protein
VSAEQRQNFVAGLTVDLDACRGLDGLRIRARGTLSNNLHVKCIDVASASTWTTPTSVPSSLAYSLNAISRG